MEIMKCMTRAATGSHRPNIGLMWESIYRVLAPYSMLKNSTRSLMAVCIAANLAINNKALIGNEITFVHFVAFQ